jgi:hypothetical protein
MQRIGARRVHDSTKREPAAWTTGDDGGGNDVNGGRGTALAIGVVLTMVLAGCQGEESGDGTGGSTSSPTAPLPNEKEAVTVEPDTYRVVPDPSSSVMAYTATFPEGWAVQYGTRFYKHQDTDGQIGFYATSLEGIYDDACTGSDGDVVEVGAGVDELATALLLQPGPQASGPFETTLGGYPATRVDLTIPAGFTGEDCNLPRGLQQLWYAEPEGYTVLFPESTASVFIVDVEGQRQVFFTEQWAGASDEDRQELHAALDSIRFET